MAFKMNRPIIKGTPLQKNNGNNSNELRPNMGGNALGIKGRGRMDEWYKSNMHKDNFGYSTYEDFKKDWPNADMQGGYATTFEGGPDYNINAERRKIEPKPIQQIPTPGDNEQPLEKAGINIDKDKYGYSKYYDVKKKEYRVRVTDKSKKSKSDSEIDNLSLDMFKEIYK